MFSLLNQILSQAVERISTQIMGFAPGLLAALFILAVCLIIAKSIRWILLKIFKGITIDRYLKRIGLSERMQRWKTPQVVAQAVYILILALGLLAALDSFNTGLASRIIETAVFLIPKILVAAAIIIISAWLGKYFGRSTLVWAVNEDIPAPRKLAAAVRALFVFSGVAAAADHLNFARSVFLSAFILILGGVVLALSLALGIGGQSSIRRYLHEEKKKSVDEAEKPLWKHL